MQIFSKLQRDSAYYVFIKLVFFYFIALLNSKNIFFPMCIGLISYAENLIISVFYFSIFSVLHQISLRIGIVFIIFLILFDYYLKKKINDYVHIEFRSFVAIFLIYAVFLILMLLHIEKIDFFYIILVVFNAAFDVLMYKIFYKR